MEVEFFEVEFDKYCPRCKYITMDESIDPCDECLGHPFNKNTEKPVKFEEKSQK